MTKNDRFNKRLSFNPEVTRKIYGLVSQIDELKGRWLGGSKLNPYVLNRLKRSVLVTSTGASESKLKVIMPVAIEVTKVTSKTISIS